MALGGIVVFAVCPHPSPLQSNREREGFRAMLFHPGTTLDGNTPSPGSTGEGWGEGLRRETLQ
jgi:hypothetical protein